MNDLFLHNRTISFQKIKRTDKRKTSFLLPLLIIATVGMGGSYYFYGKYSAITTNPDLEVRRETEALVTSVGKLMELPKNETPAVAVISDKEKLKDKPFFQAAEEGDRLLAYNTAMIAIIYRPRINKIINVAPISFSQP